MIAMRELFFAAGFFALAATQACAEAPLRRLLVLDFEIVDTSGEPLDQRAEHAKRLRLVRETIANEVAARNMYVVEDNGKIGAEIAAVLEHQHLRACNGCEIDLARHAGADLVLTGQVYKVSTLIMYMRVLMTDVATGARLFERTFDFRGDSDQSWLRAARYVVNRIAEHPPD